MKRFIGEHRFELSASLIGLLLIVLLFVRKNGMSMYKCIFHTIFIPITGSAKMWSAGMQRSFAESQSG